MIDKDHPTQGGISSDDIKLANENGHLINPYTGGDAWYHCSTEHIKQFSNDYLENADFVGTYFSSCPHATLSNSLAHVAHLSMSNPLLIQDHWDINRGRQNEPLSDEPRLQNARYFTVKDLVHHYIKKYGAKLFPEKGDNSETSREIARNLFLEKQKTENDRRISERAKLEDQLKSFGVGTHTDSEWDVKAPTFKFEAPPVVLDTTEFENDYLKNFSKQERFQVIRNGLRFDGHDGVIFHYGHDFPTVFCIDPEKQITVKEIKHRHIAGSEGDQERADNIVQGNPNADIHGYQSFARVALKNDLFGAEQNRGTGNRAK